MDSGGGEGETDRRQAEGDPAEAALRRVGRLLSPAWPWRLAALLYLTAVSGAALVRSSVLIDGQRFFFLDDDQMVSMRYARNLVEGHGLVWNVGERVEGYSNPLWTLVMAGIHALPLTDATTSAAVLVLNWLLSCGVVLLSERLLEVLRPDPGILRPVLLLALASNLDVLFWSVNGFETPLLCLLSLAALLRTLSETGRGEGLGLLTALLIGLLPLVRSDGHHVAAGVCAVALLRSDGRRLATAVRLLPALALPSLHVVFRLLYYGDLLPNTFYLKVSQVPGRPLAGLWYLTAFAYRYGVPMVLFAAGLLVGARGDRRTRLGLATAFAVSSLYVVTVGGDTFSGSRFLAPLVPVLLAGALAAVPDLVPRSSLAAGVLAAVVLVSVSATAGVHGRTGLSRLRFPNGYPEVGTVAGRLIRESTAEDAVVAVLAAGAVPYFSHRPSLDLLGKCDRRVSHLPADGPRIGHNKMDPELSLALRPDLVVGLSSLASLSTLEEGGASAGFAARLVRSPTFESAYRGNPVDSRFLRGRMCVFARTGTTKVASLDPAAWPPRWREPSVSP